MISNSAKYQLIWVQQANNRLYIRWLDHLLCFEPPCLESIHSFHCGHLSQCRVTSAVAQQCQVTITNKLVQNNHVTRSVEKFLSWTYDGPAQNGNSYINFYIKSSLQFFNKTSSQSWVSYQLMWLILNVHFSNTLYLTDVLYISSDPALR